MRSTTKDGIKTTTIGASVSNHNDSEHIDSVIYALVMIVIQIGLK